MIRKNIIRLYGLIWGYGSPEIQSELKGNTDYSTHYLTYDCLWLLTKIKMYKSDINHTSNGYYYAVMGMRDILCLRQEKDENIKYYYRRFEVAISTSEPAK